MRPENAPTDPAATCPVDPKTRERWLEAAKGKKQAAQLSPPKSQSLPAPTSTVPSIAAPRYSLDAARWISNISSPTSSPTPSSTRTTPRQQPILNLPADREVSTIPRALALNQTLNSAELAALPSNSEQDTGHDKASGNWVYPSQQQFFAAMRRKGHAADPTDMSSIVPIHNAVNERAWAEIKLWEAGRGVEKCGGPRLLSFAGDSKAKTPRARWNALMGYAEPFDRHDWVVDRCGTRVEYVIDFYAGKEDEKGLAKGLSFYLDVRPKLNSWEGIKMRAAKSLGL